MSRIKNVVEYGRKIAVSATIGTALYIATLCAAQEISYFRSPKISSQSHLEQILDSEKKRAGIKEGIVLKVTLSDENVVSHAAKICEGGIEGGYEIILGSLQDVSVSLLRHELYHVAKNHPECGEMSVRSKFIYLFWDEPQATIYQVTGFKP